MNFRESRWLGTSNLGKVPPSAALMLHLRHHGKNPV